MLHIDGCSDAARRYERGIGFRFPAPAAPRAAAHRRHPQRRLRRDRDRQGEHRKPGTNRGPPASRGPIRLESLRRNPVTLLYGHQDSAMTVFLLKVTLTFKSPLNVKIRWLGASMRHLGHR